jgi:hypothetical protein
MLPNVSYRIVSYHIISYHGGCEHHGGSQSPHVCMVNDTPHLVQVTAAAELNHQIVGLLQAMLRYVPAECEFQRNLG